MFRGTITNAVVCGKEGGDTEHPIRIYEGDNYTICSFWVGIAVYDTNAPNKQRYTNWLIKAFGKAAERIKGAPLKRGTRINISGEVDQTTYEGKNGTRIISFIKITDWNDIEIIFSGEKKAEKLRVEDKPKEKELVESEVNLDQNDPFLSPQNGIIFD